GLASIGDTLPLSSCAVFSSFRSLFLLLCGAHPERGPCSSSPCRSLGSCPLVESTISTRCSCRPREEVPAPPCTLQTTEEKCQRVELRAGAASLILVSWLRAMPPRRSTRVANRGRGRGRGCGRGRGQSDPEVPPEPVVDENPGGAEQSIAVDVDPEPAPVAPAPQRMTFIRWTSLQVDKFDGSWTPTDAADWLRKGSKIVDEYEREFSNIVRFVPTAASDEREKARKFFRGLNAWYREVMGRNPPTTYLTAVEEARGMESEIQLTALQKNRSGGGTSAGGDRRELNRRWRVLAATSPEEDQAKPTIPAISVIPVKAV
ncbi:hypothetical protein U9M48_030420, partial [Paspalum notatum var. saurae]